MQNSKLSKSFLKNIQQFFKFFDLYGQNVNLLINKKPKFYTTCSGMISMVVMSLIIFTFMGYITSWLNNEKITPIPSSISYSSIELLAKNENYEFEFTYQNYDIYWVLSATLPNGTYLGTKDLNNYFTYYLFHENEYFLSEEIITEPCKTDQIDKFLGMTEDKIEHDRGKIGINRICIRDSFKMGLFPNNSLSTVAAPSIAFLVYPCMNSTSNNNSCAPKEAIYDMIPYTTVQTTIPTTIYDFKNYKKLQKNIYDYHFTKLDHSMLKYYQNQLTTSTLYVDDGLLSDNYRSESTNFNPNINYDPNLRKDDDPLFVFECQLSLNFQNYYLRNQKLNEIAGNLGGLINVIFLLGKLLCATYNSIYLKFKIISSTFLFSNSNVKKDGIFPKGMTSSMNISKFSIKSKFAKNFSYMSYLFPSKELRMFYQKGAKNLHEYLDIRKIIKRLQEIDKLKMILLTDEQRRLFEYIPKPDVVNSSNKLFLESILKYTKNVKQKIMTGVPNNMKSLVEEDNPINKRILEFVDSNHLIKNEGLENDGISFIIRIEFFKFLLNQR